MAGDERVDANFSEDHETFRNELASVARDGRRRWIYARQPSGRLYRARTLVSVFLLAFLFLAPFINVGGQPLMLLDVLNRRFVLLGVVFWPQDFYIVVLIALTALVVLLLSTVVVGRVWCGWLCPQTIFMEMVFRRLEYWIDGSAEQQLRRLAGEAAVGQAPREGARGDHLREALVDRLQEARELLRVEGAGGEERQLGVEPHREARAPGAENGGAIFRRDRQRKRLLI